MMNAVLRIVVAVVAIGLFAGAPIGADEFEGRVDEIVGAAMAATQIPGVSVGVARGGETILAKGYGMADLENAVPATAHTVYRIGSVTKQFTAAAILLLVERGKVALDDPLARFLPDYDTHGETITVRRLLNHTCGIKGYTEMPEFWKRATEDLSPEEMMELFGSEPLEFAPGEKYQYSNSGYYLLGQIVEKASGKTYEQFLRDEVFGRLQLDETHYLDNAPIVPGRAEGYEVRDAEVVNDDPLSMRLPYSAGSLGASVGDLLRWQQALATNELISGESLAAMTAPGVLTSGAEISYGYGLGLGELEGRRKIAHGGGINGFRAQLAWYPDHDLTIVVLSNSGASSPGVIESAIARAALGIQERAILEVPMNREELSLYAGVYDPGRSPIPVLLVGGELRLGRTRLRPVGEHTFYPEGDDHRRVTFEVSGGRSRRMRIEREGQVTEAPRVE
ncbi:MAG: serine hydrolase domain-containing protein [Acidobacteriota bacterium]|nr:serine hydrolase domain-containing protein [Acidobacteriota bacterium]